MDIALNYSKISVSTSNQSSRKMPNHKIVTNNINLSSSDRLGLLKSESKIDENHTYHNNFDILNNEITYTDDVETNTKSFENKKVDTQESHNLRKSNINKEKDQEKNDNFKYRIKLLANISSTDDNSMKNNNSNITNNGIDNSKHDPHNNKHLNSNIKMLIYSGHDSTMVPLLRAIGLYKGIIIIFFGDFFSAFFPLFPFIFSHYFDIILDLCDIYYEL